MRHTNDSMSDVLLSIYLLHENLAMIDGSVLDQIFDKAGMSSLPNNLILEF